MNEVPYAYLLCSPRFYPTDRYSSDTSIDGCGVRADGEGGEIFEYDYAKSGQYHWIEWRYLMQDLRRRYGDIHLE